MIPYSTYRTSSCDWIDRIPANWRAQRIKSIFGLRDERNFKPLNEVNLISLYTGLGVRQHKDIEHTTGNKARNADGYKVVYPDDIVVNIVLCWMGAIGRSDYHGVTSPAYDIYKPKTTEINTQYYNYLMRTPIFAQQCYKVGKGIMAMRWRTYSPQFSNIVIPVPPREEQDQIVCFLDWKVSSINRLINIKQEQLRKVKELLDRLFRDTTSKCSKKVKIKYLFELDDDFFVPDASESYAKAGMYNRGRGIFLREPCLGNELGDSQFQHIHSDRLMLSGQFAWEDAVYITQEKDTHGIASHRYYLLKPVRYIPVEYLWLYFLSGEGFFNLQQCSHGSAGRNRPLNIKEVLNLELPVPDDKEKANALNELVRDYMRLQVITEEEKKALLDFKTHLVADIVTGKIDVRGIEIPEYEFVDEDIDNADEVMEQGVNEPLEEE